MGRMRRAGSVGCIAAIAALTLPAALPTSAAGQAQTDFPISSDQQVGDFLRGLTTPGATVRIASHVRLNVSGRRNIPIAAGVTVLGGRTARTPGPLIYVNRRDQVANSSLFIIQGNRVRITGVRIRGPDTRDPSRIPGGDVATAITSDAHTDIEIDHNEIYGWRGSAIKLEDDDEQNRGVLHPSSSPTVRVHENFIHHNQHNGRQGYGVVVGGGAYPLIDRNVFDYNRHAIAGDGSDGSGYIAQDNLVLQHGGKHRWIPTSVLLQVFGIPGFLVPVPGVWVQTHPFDMHGQDNCGASSILFDTVFNCGTAGHSMYVRYNSFLYTGRISLLGRVGRILSRFLPRAAAIKLRGIPQRAADQRCGAFVASNVFEHERLNDAVQRTAWARGLCKTRNLVRGGRLRRVLTCDVDGDGIRDSFMVTGQSWWWAHARTGPWTFLRRTTARPRSCPAPGTLVPPPPDPNQPQPQPNPPPGQPQQPPTPGPAPDLVISSMAADQFTVTNQGATAAGQFRVSVVTASGTHDFDFAGLAIGESQTRMYNRPCGEPREARADSLNQVGESNEANNTATHPGPSIC